MKRPNFLNPSRFVRSTLGLLVGASMLLTALPATAEVPGFVPVQGRLTDATGAVVDGDVDVVTTLYVDEGGGSLTEIWSAQRTITVEQGSFSLYLGTEVELDMELFADNPNVLLGLAFGDDNEMPLIEVGTVPYAAHCQMAVEAQTVAGLPPEQLGPLGGLNCTDGQVATYQAGAWACADRFTESDVDQKLVNDGYVTDSDISPVATSGDFADLQNVPADLADGDDDTLGGLLCANGQVAEQTAAGWACADIAVPQYTSTAPIQISGTNISLAPDGVTGAYIAPETLTDGDVAPNAAIAPSKIAGTAATITGDQSFDSGTLAIASTTDRVGVGTTAPASKLHVAGDARVEGDFVYDTPRTGYVQVTPAAFKLDLGSEDEIVSYGGISGYLYISGGTSTYGISMTAPISLPHDATVTALTCYGYDNNSSVDLSMDVDLFRRGMIDTGGSGSMANADLGTTGVAISAVQTATDTTISNPVIDNSQYHYWLDLYMYTGDQLGSTLRFYGCKIAYETTTLTP